ncbi:hypothetical protein OIV83_004998 [Microbotryomycetes sp. JL201]|nr:hypothetical protein OIV83_004998 [Microbotryomycetes sp. JL201]
MARLAPPFDSRFCFHDDEIHEQQQRGAPATTNASPHRHTLKRSSSALSLPSPPDDISPSLLLSRDSAGDYDMATVDGDFDDQIDELESDDEPCPAPQRPHYTTRPTAQQLYESDPFLAPARRVSDTQVDSINRGHLRVAARAQVCAAAPAASSSSASPIHMSPTDRARRKKQDRERIMLDGPIDSGKNHFGPRSMGKGWDSPGNPFIERPTRATAAAGSQQQSENERDRETWTPGRAVKPDRLTYVFRGKRVTYDIPFDSLVAAEDPDDDPFPETKPRLLFPPAVEPPITPPSLMSNLTSASFVDALRNGPGPITVPKTAIIPASPIKQGSGDGLPPTPVTGKRRHVQSRDAEQQQSRFSKKLKLGDSPPKRVLRR